jgi:ABC-type Zn uptake system ZnuABC Zn-binding protein ZnuA
MSRCLARAVVCLAAALLPFAAGCGKAADPWGGTTKPRVLTSIVPIHCLTACVAEPDAEVRCLLSGTGPHEFQSTPEDARMLSTADLFIVNGLGLEEFLHNLVRSAGNRKLKVVETAERIPPADRIEAEGLPHFHGDKLVVHKGTDPHVWLGVAEAKKQVEAIRDALKEVDPAHAAGYDQRAADVLARLDRLQAGAKDIRVPGGLATFHDSFRYFGRSFNIPIAGTIRGVKAEEISVAELTRQAAEFRAKGVRLISVEPQYPRKVAESLAEAMGRDKVRLVELDPIETGPNAGDRNHYVDKNYYFERMEANLANLRRATQP